MCISRCTQAERERERATCICSGMCAALLIDGHLVATTPALQKHALLAIIASRISSNLQNISVWTVTCICLSTKFPSSLKIATIWGCFWDALRSLLAFRRWTWWLVCLGCTSAVMVSEGLKSNMSNRATYLMYTILNANICTYVCVLYIYYIWLCHAYLEM